MRESIVSKHYLQPAKVQFSRYAFITRELVPNGGILVDDEIFQVIDTEKHKLLFFGQWLPDGAILEHLLAASRRGVQVSVYTNFPKLGRESIYTPFRIRLVRKLASTGIDLFVPAIDGIFFHVKALLAGYGTDRRVAITGTDNMVNSWLQKWGTREILIRLHDESAITELEAFLQAEVINKARSFEWREASIKGLLRSAKKEDFSTNYSLGS